MHIILVDIHVKPECVEAFTEATLENARSSITEEGILRFDALQAAEDPQHFILYEVYRRPEDQALHRQTPHYNRWKETVEEMMAEPRQPIRCKNLFPPDADWHK